MFWLRNKKINFWYTLLTIGLCVATRLESEMGITIIILDKQNFEHILPLSLNIYTLHNILSFFYDLHICWLTLLYHHVLVEK